MEWFEPNLNNSAKVKFKKKKFYDTKNRQNMIVHISIICAEQVHGIYLLDT